MTHGYHVLTSRQRADLRIERTLLLETDLYRAELQLEEALTDNEREAVSQEIVQYQTRLDVHYRKLFPAKYKPSESRVALSEPEPVEPPKGMMKTVREPVAYG